MGDFSAEAWGTDEAADWFARFWRGPDVSLLVQEIEGFDPRAERYEAFRAAAYLLQVLGVPTVWPADRLSRLGPLLDRAIEVLGHFLAPPDEAWGFLDAWGDDPAVVAAVRAQIAALEARRAALA